MEKKEFLINILKIKKCIFWIMILFSSLIKINSEYFQIFQLSSRYVIWVSSASIFRYDQEFQTTLNSYKLCDAQKLNESNTDELELVRFSEYLDEFGYLITSIKSYIYFFDYNGILLSNFDLKLFSEYQISLISYKCLNESNIFECYYFISYINSEKKIGIYWYKISNDSTTYENELISNIIYTPINSLESETVSSCKTLTCQVMNYNCKEDVLTCFYENETPNELVAINFNIKNNNINILNSLPPIFYTNDGCQQIESTLSLNKTKAFICYINNQNELYCLFYDIQKNCFENAHIVFNKCVSNRRSLFENKYNGAVKEYLLGCYPTLDTFIFKRFDLNYNSLLFNNIETCSLSFNDSNSCTKIDYSVLYYVWFADLKLKYYELTFSCVGKSGHDYLNTNTLCKINFDYENTFNDTIICEIQEEENEEKEEKLENEEEEEKIEKEEKIENEEEKKNEEKEKIENKENEIYEEEENFKESENKINEIFKNITNKNS